MLDLWLRRSWSLSRKKIRQRLFKISLSRLGHGFKSCRGRQIHIKETRCNILIPYIIFNYSWRFRLRAFFPIWFNINCTTLFFFGNTFYTCYMVKPKIFKTRSVVSTFKCRRKGCEEHKLMVAHMPPIIANYLFSPYYN